MSDDVPTSSPRIGSAYRHVPAHADVINLEFAGLYRDNRWNLASERTLYVAGDQGVLAAEWARHLPYPWPADTGRRSLARQVYRLGTCLDHVVDVRSPESIQRFGIDPSSNWIVDMASTRNIARVVRDSTPAEAIIGDHRTLDCLH